MKKLIPLTFTVFFMVVLIAWAIIRIVTHYQFSVGCGQYLKRAATANSITLASSNLDTAIQYLEDHNLTSGQVSIFLKQPKNDITYWYTNLKSAQTELMNMKPDATQLEISNELMKIKESLISTTSSGESLIYPDGIQIYPHNAVLFWMSFISVISGFALLIWLTPKNPMKWIYKYGENTIIVVNRISGETLIVNGEIQDQKKGIKFKSELRGKLSSGEEIKATIGGNSEMICSLFIDNKLQTPEQ